MNPSTFSLTPSERAFLDQYHHEIFTPFSGPANEWLRNQNLHQNLMAPFQRWALAQDPDFAQKMTDTGFLPSSGPSSFEVPWSSREDFLARVEELLDFYPDLKPLVSEFLSPRVMV